MDLSKIILHFLSPAVFGIIILIFGFENAPSCIDRHVKKGQSVHRIMSYRDPDSVAFEENRYRNCKDSNSWKKLEKAIDATPTVYAAALENLKKARAALKGGRQ